MAPIRPAVRIDGRGRSTIAGATVSFPGKPSSMPKQAAGLLPYRLVEGRLEVLLVHPGGPFWARRDDGAWSIAKGEIEPGEEPLAAARREFEEETGSYIGADTLPLRPLRQPSGKVIHAFAVQADFDPATLRSNTFSLEWPRRSGRMREFPEVDRAAWFGIDDARTKILGGQAPLLDELLERLRQSADGR